MNWHGKTAWENQVRKEKNKQDPNSTVGCHHLSSKRAGENIHRISICTEYSKTSYKKLVSLVVSRKGNWDTGVGRGILLNICLKFLIWDCENAMSLEGERGRENTVRVLESNGWAWIHQFSQVSAMWPCTSYSAFLKLRFCMKGVWYNDTCNPPGPLEDWDQWVRSA